MSPIRFLGFSFGGTCFTLFKCTHNHHHPHKPSCLFRLLLFTVHLLVFSYHSIQLLGLFLYSDPFSLFKPWQNPRNRRQEASTAQDSASFTHLKPILRFLCNSTIYLILFEVLFNYIFNLFYGHRLLNRLSQLPNVRKFDIDKTFAFRFLFGALLVIVVYMAVGVGTFMDLRGPEGPRRLLLIVRGRLPFEMYYYFVFLLTPCWFAYLMITCKRNIVILGEERETLQIDDLSTIQGELEILSKRLKEIVHLLALPLTVSLVTDILVLIGTLCFLILHQNTPHHHLPEHDQNTVFFFNVSVFQLFRLLLICWSGSLASTAHEDLLATIYDKATQKWDLEMWTAFQEIKRIGGKFEVSIGGVYRLRQATILTVLGFVLNYIVVLLQTETYQKAA